MDRKFIFNAKKCRAVFDSAKILLTVQVTGLILFLSCLQLNVAVASSGSLPAHKVTGTVIDQTSGEPLVGVTIQVKNSQAGTVTDGQGKFSIEVDDGDILVVSFVGYNTQEVPVSGNGEIHIQLLASSTGLNQIVVVGYGTRAKEELTGSIATIDNEQLVRSRTEDLEKSLQGMSPGLVVRDIGGEPGREDAQILIRGVHTLGDNSPLFVVDGVPQNSISNISPYDIESISVLKDASAAIYGARAANGVILVRTKRGKEGKPQINLNLDYGFNELTREPHFFTSEQYAIYRNEALESMGTPAPFSEEDIEKYRTGSDPLTHPNTDWYRASFRKTAPRQNQNFSISGGSDKVQYFVSGSHEKQEAIYSSKDGGAERYQLRSNIDIQAHKYLKFGVDLNIRWDENKQPPVGIDGITHRAWFNFPTEVARYPNGLPGTVHEDGNTTVINSFETGYDLEKNRDLQPRLSFDLNMDWLTQGLGVKGYGAFYYSSGDSTVFQRPVTTYTYDPSTDDYLPHSTTYPGGGHVQLNEWRSDRKDRLYNLQIYYKRRFNKHGIDAFVAYENNVTEYSWLQAGRRDLFSENKVELFAGQEDGRTVNGSSLVGGRVNYFGSFSYDYDRKYMLDFTFRRDGSFNFPNGKRFGNFPSISLAWNLARENFLSDFDQLNSLKLRFSYGNMGNDKIPPYQYLTRYNTGSFSIFGTGSTFNPGLTIANIPNPNITWERSQMLNYGLDATLWNQKFSFTLDVFSEKRKDILIQRSLSVPQYTAIELPLENLGRVNNKGIEFSLGYNNNVGDLSYTLGGNFTYNKSRIVFMDEPKNIPDYQKQEGHPVNSILALQSEGLYRSQEEIDNSLHIDGELPGDIKYTDLNGDGTINDADRKRFYVSPIPEIQFALNGGLSYRGIDFSFMFQGQGKATTVLRFNDDGGKPQEYFTKRWTVDNPGAKMQRAVIGRSPYNPLSSYHFKDASYLRLKSLELGYDLAHLKSVSKLSVNQLRLFARARNLLTLDHIKIFDPEVPYQPDLDRGSRAKYYPQMITYSFGLNLTF